MKPSDAIGEIAQRKGGQVADYVNAILEYLDATTRREGVEGSALRDYLATRDENFVHLLREKFDQHFGDWLLRELHGAHAGGATVSERENARMGPCPKCDDTGKERTSGDRDDIYAGWKCCDCTAGKKLARSISPALSKSETTQPARVASWCNSIEHAKNGCPPDCPDQRVIEDGDQAAALDAYVYALANGPPHIRESWSGLSDEARGFFVLFFRFARGIGRLENANSIPQPATGDGTGEDGVLDPRVGSCPVCGAGVGEYCRGVEIIGAVHYARVARLVAAETALARQIPTYERLQSDASMHTTVTRGLRASLEELKEKLAAAEASLRRILDDDEPGVSLETLIERVELDVNCEWERAEQAEARVRACEAVIVATERAIVHHKNDRNRPWSITQLAEAFDALPAEHRPEVKP